MDLNDDPKIWTLPHPVRMEAAVNGEQVDRQMFEHLGVLAGLEPYLGDAHASTEWIINNVPRMFAVGQTHFGLLGGENMGSFMLTVARTRLRAQGDPILQLSTPLQTMLAQTDLVVGLPCRYFRPPSTLVYIEFSRPNALRVSNQLSGLHECEGAYLGSYELPAGHEVFHNPARNRALGLDPSQPVRAVEIVITGSPIGKSGVLDDASRDTLLLIQYEDECLQTVLERHMAWYNNPAAYANLGMAPVRADDVAMLRPVVELLAKALLYLHLGDAEQVKVNARSELARKRKGLGYKKQARLQRKLAAAYDRIVIGPASFPAPAEPQNHDSTGEAQRSVKAHWRRGHFRTILYGEKRRKQRLGWIKPVLVNAAQAFEAAKTKPYVVS
ncbi:hypothetical protein CKO42_08315 [Lamprobacter modestohalophilus]|uniref:Uncharacterized protein n=1 Tax=Lamprobacter modestohalophilus TaxID=1064514 RepID=A0A9X0W7X6_9GAMM|nr:hypothetical protein [Lamprobacter modestohalophilus]MBK1618439.1 hypothetical protein [Lamprobacter modestohalophilus]